MKKGTSLVTNTSQTVQIKDKKNEKKPYLEQNISNHKLEGSDKKATGWERLIRTRLIRSST